MYFFLQTGSGSKESLPVLSLRAGTVRFSFRRRAVYAPGGSLSYFLTGGVEDFAVSDDEQAVVSPF